MYREIAVEFGMGIIFWRTLRSVLPKYVHRLHLRPDLSLNICRSRIVIVVRRLWKLPHDIVARDVITAIYLDENIQLHTYF